MLPDLLHHLMREWRGALTDANIFLEEPLYGLKVAGAAGQDRKVNWLVFDHRNPTPVLLMKMTRSLRNHDKLVREFENLKSVSAIPAMKGRMPEPIGLFPYGETFVMIESCVPGVSLKSLLAGYRRLRRSQVKKNLETARDWLAAFQTATRRGDAHFAGQAEVQKRIERGQYELPSQFVDDLLRLAMDAEGMKIPLCARHGDFWPGNFMLTRDGCGVIDWEGYSPAAWPFVDVFSFAITFSWSYSWQGLVDLERRDAFARAFLKKNWLSAMLRSFMEDMLCAPYGIGRRFLRLFFSLFLMDMAAPDSEENAVHVVNADLWRDHLNFFAEYARDSSQI